MNQDKYINNILKEILKYWIELEQIKDCMIIRMQSFKELMYNNGESFLGEKSKISTYNKQNYYYEVVM